MGHITVHTLEKYIDNDVNEQDQEVIESHIYHCEQCMKAYISLIEDHRCTQTVSADFTDQVVSKINLHPPQQINTPGPTHSRKVIGHYFLAAGLTILLMVTGVFQSVLDAAANDQLDNKPSITNQVMEETDRLLNQIKEDHKQ